MFTPTIESRHENTPNASDGFSPSRRQRLKDKKIRQTLHHIMAGCVQKNKIDALINIHGINAQNDLRNPTYSTSKRPFAFWTSTYSMDLQTTLALRVLSSLNEKRAQSFTRIQKNDSYCYYVMFELQNTHGWVSYRLSYNVPVQKIKIYKPGEPCKARRGERGLKPSWASYL